MPHTLALTTTSNKTAATCFMAGLIRAEGSRPDFYPPVRVPHNFDAGVFFLLSVYLVVFTLNMNIKTGCLIDSTPDKRLVRMTHELHYCRSLVLV